MSVMNVLAVITVADLGPAVAWYERLLGRPADRNPMEGLVEWQITAGGGIQVWRDADRAGNALATLGVNDLDAHVADLAGKGLTPSATTATDSVQTATFTDPEGNRITLAESLGNDA